jgi:hypothetical protein
MLHDQSRAVCPFPCCMSMSILHVRVHAPCLCQYPCKYLEMPECRTVRHPVSPVPDWKNLTMPEQVQYRTKRTQSGIFIVRYWTKIRDAGMPMPALVSSMPMPSYAYIYGYKSLCRVTKKRLVRANTEIRLFLLISMEINTPSNIYIIERWLSLLLY